MTELDQQFGVSQRGDDSTRRENKDEPPRCVTTSAALTSTSGTSRTEADVDIIVPQSDETGQHTREDIARLQRLLAESIVARSWLMDRMTALEAETPDRHWFVADPAGYCQACNLPEKNARHVPRVA